MQVALLGQGTVGWRAVSMHSGAWGDRIAHKGQHIALGVQRDASEPDTPKAFGLEKLHCNGDEGFGGVALATNSGPGLPTLGDCNIGLVDLDVALQLLASRTHHASAQPMQDGPAAL